MWPYVPYVLLVLVGLFTGIMGGMLGIGGSVIMMPAMYWLLGVYVGENDQTHQYMAATMIVNFLLSLPAVWAHVRKKAVWPKVIVWMAPAGAVGAVLGVWLSGAEFAGQNTRYLRWGLGAMFMLLAISGIYKTFRPPKEDGEERDAVERRPAWLKGGIGAVVGTFAGLTGLGGGVLAVPANHYLLGMPLRFAIANSSALILAMAWVGAITKNLSLQAEHGGTVERSLVLAACLAPTAMIGAFLGGHLTHRIPRRALRLGFAMLLAVASVKAFEGLLTALGMG